MHHFKTGDILEVIADNNVLFTNENIKKGMLCWIECDKDGLNLVFDDNIGGHTGAYHEQTMGHCWWVPNGAAKFFKFVGRRDNMPRDNHVAVIRKIKQMNERWELKQRIKKETIYSYAA